MNKKRRDELRTAINMLEVCNDIVNRVCDDESECLENIPENLQSSDMYYNMEDAVDNLESAIDYLDSATSLLEAAMV